MNPAKEVSRLADLFAFRFLFHRTLFDRIFRVAIMALMAPTAKTASPRKSPLPRPTFVAAKEAKNRFGELLEAVQRHPIIITKHNRPVARIVAYAHRTRFEEVEDQVWGERADKAAKKGYPSAPASAAALQRALRYADARPR